MIPYSAKARGVSSAKACDVRSRGATQDIRALRLSVTDRCNFRCRYCMPPEGIRCVARAELLSLEKLSALAGWLTEHTKIDTVRLTGGEPLVRPGIEQLITTLSTLPAIQEVCLTTNGSLLRNKVWSLRAAGLTRVNVSLDSLSPERFARITRGGKLKNTLEGIEAARAAGLLPIKLNAVLLRSTWQEDIPPLLDYAASEGYEIRFIELMRTGTDRAWCDTEFVSADEVRRGLTLYRIAAKTPEVTSAPSRGMTAYWRGRPVKIGWITPRSSPFCAHCDRLRLDASGIVRRCLMDPISLNLAGLVDQNDEHTASATFSAYVADKRHPVAMKTALAMRQIGG